MPDWLTDLWFAIPTLAQDIVVLIALLAPMAVVAWLLGRGFVAMPLVSALLRRYAGTNALFVGLIALSVGIGCGLIAQERGIRQGSARAADGFDLIVAAPGSEITALFAAVYLQPSDVPLLDGPTFDAIASHRNVRLAAPLAFGDSWELSPVVGTIADFVTHLSGDLTEGRMFASLDEAVVGWRVPLEVGDSFTPSHGIGAAAEEDAHAGVHVSVTGRMAPTGTPWDDAILVPVEHVWVTHGLANGHPPDTPLDVIGPPFAPDHFPGTPAVLVVPNDLYQAYGLQATFTTTTSMAFLPGSVLSQLHRLMGNVRAAMSALAIVTQILVTASVLAGLFLLSRLFARQLALLGALGAPRRFVVCVIWTYATTLILLGTAAGAAVAYASLGGVSGWLTSQTGILIRAYLSWPEVHLMAAFASLASLFALIPGLRVQSRNQILDLRG